MPQYVITYPGDKQKMVKYMKWISSFGKKAAGK